jgi:hypothetical protein
MDPQMKTPVNAFASPDQDRAFLALAVSSLFLVMGVVTVGAKK